MPRDWKNHPEAMKRYCTCTYVTAFGAKAKPPVITAWELGDGYFRRESVDPNCKLHGDNPRARPASGVPMNPRAYKDWLAQKGSAASGKHPVVLHHVKGVVSLKTGQRLRPRQGLADVALIPLTPDEHAELHETSEGVFEIDHLGGAGAALGLAFAYLAQYALEGRP